VQEHLFDILGRENAITAENFRNEAQHTTAESVSSLPLLTGRDLDAQTKNHDSLMRAMEGYRIGAVQALSLTEQ
jgi:hypothetical protein